MSYSKYFCGKSPLKKEHDGPKPNVPFAESTGVKHNVQTGLNFDEDMLNKIKKTDNDKKQIASLVSSHVYPKHSVVKGGPLDISIQNNDLAGVRESILNRAGVEKMGPIYKKGCKKY